MPITINGAGTISGLVSGGLSDQSIVNADIVDNTITFAKFLTSDWANSHGPAGYQRLPSNLLIQWGSSNANTAGVNVVFATGFTTQAYCVVATNNNQTNPPSPSCGNLSLTGFTATVSAGTPNFFYIAIGK